MPQFLKACSITLLIAFLGLLGLIGFVAFHFRTQIVLNDYADGEGAEAYRFVGKGNLLSHRPSRVLQIQFQTAGSADAEHCNYLAQVPLSPEELAADLRLWQSDPELKFLHDAVPDDPPPDYWPSWFPRPSTDTYVGTVLIHENEYIKVYRDPHDSTHVYIHY